MENISLERKEGIAKIVLNRPEALNALNTPLLSELAGALEEVEKDPQTKVAIITGAGRAFSAGMDMKEVSRVEEGLPRRIELAWEISQKIEGMSKPVIAMVNGYCYTGALELIMHCDMIIASESAVFADTHARYGLIHGWGGTQHLPRLIGTMKAKELLFASEPVTAAEAERIGLVNKVVPAGKLEEFTKELAGKIIKNSETSVKAIKSLVNRGIRMNLKEGLKLEASEYKHRQLEGIISPGRKERLEAFLEKER